MRPKRFALGAKVAGLTTHQGNIDLVVAEGFDSLRSIPHDKLQVNTLMLAQECRDQLGREILGC